MVEGYLVPYIMGLTIIGIWLKVNLSLTLGLTIIGIWVKVNLYLTLGLTIIGIWLKVNLNLSYIRTDNGFSMTDLFL